MSQPSEEGKPQNTRLTSVRAYLLDFHRIPGSLWNCDKNHTHLRLGATRQMLLWQIPQCRVHTEEERWMKMLTDLCKCQIKKWDAQLSSRCNRGVCNQIWITFLIAGKQSKFILFMNLQSMLSLLFKKKKKREIGIIKGEITANTAFDTVLKMLHCCYTSWNFLYRLFYPLVSVRTFPVIITTKTTLLQLWTKETTRSNTRCPPDC